MPEEQAAQSKQSVTRQRRWHGTMAGLLGALMAAPAVAQPPSGTPAPTPAPPATSPGAPPLASQGAPAPTGTPTVLTLDQAVRAAMAQNPSLDEARAAVRRAEGVVAEARAIQLPRLDGNAQFTLQGPIPSFTFTQPPDQPGGQPRRQQIAFGRAFTKTFNLSATYDVDPFGRNRDTVRAARRNQEAFEGNLATTQNELVFATQNLYLATLRSQELIRVAQESLQSAAEQLRVSEAGFRAGTAAEFDVIRGRVQVANVRQTLVTAEASYRRALATLAEILSLEPNERLELVPVALPPEPPATPGLGTVPAPAPSAAPPAAAPAGDQPESVLSPATPLPDTLADALAEALERRPEVYSAIQFQRAAEARLAFQRKGNRPSVTLTGGVLYAPDQAGLAFETTTWSIIGNIAVPIWDAGLTRARTRQARADVEAAAADVETARDAVAEEVKRALLDLEDAAERRRSAAANTVQAREALRIAQVRYNAGLAPVVEVIDAEAALTQARTNEVNAAYDYLAALAFLNRSLGRYVPQTAGSQASEGGR